LPLRARSFLWSHPPTTELSALSLPDALPISITGYDGAVIGDSRAARLGGPPVPDGSPDDVACQRSTDSLAAEIGRLLPARVLNLDRKSTRLNSSHVKISYAVFCLKKKKIVQS